MTEDRRSAKERQREAKKQYQEVWRIFEKWGFSPKRGRPRLPSWDEFVPWDKIVWLTPEEAPRADAMMWLHRLQTRNRGGRPADHDLNQKLLEGANDARRRGILLRDFCKIWFANKFGREPTPDEVKVVERRFGRARNKKSPK